MFGGRRRSFGGQQALDIAVAGDQARNVSAGRFGEFGAEMNIVAKIVDAHRQPLERKRGRVAAPAPGDDFIREPPSLKIGIRGMNTNSSLYFAACCCWSASSTRNWGTTNACSTVGSFIPASRAARILASSCAPVCL